MIRSVFDELAGLRLVGGLQGVEIALDALFDLLLAGLDLGGREVAVSAIDRLEFAAVDGDRSLREQLEVANWQLASLPKSLEPAEVEQLEAALVQSGPSMLRADAMVRCALHLGLRSGEVVRLGLDDIDWEAATITLRRTKGRRKDVMPLPEATGRAIAAYLRNERPKTQHRRVFARHMTPREQPIGPDLVRKTIRQAYARAGLRHTRSHMLRHTMASRLLAGGSSLKEVADVLRHLSLNTTLIYAKLDSGRLVEVALPWPGTSAAATGRTS